jgi:hypothetical protein
VRGRKKIFPSPIKGVDKFQKIGYNKIKIRGEQFSRCGATPLLSTTIF